MGEIVCYDKVWVSPKPEKIKGPEGYIAKFNWSEGDRFCVTRIGGGHEIVNRRNVYPLIQCPIDESSNLNTDWIEGEILTDTTSYHDDGTLGWILHECDYYPVYFHVDYKSSNIMFLPVIEGQADYVRGILRKRIEELCNFCEGNDIVANVYDVGNKLYANFYYIDKN